MSIRIAASIDHIARSEEARHRKATAIALTKTGADVSRALVDEMRSTFDRPTPFTLRAFRLRMATMSSMEAVVYAMPRQASYLATQIEGGSRPSAGFERRIQTLGGRPVVPGAGAQLNSYGNMSLAFIKRATAAASKRFFIGKPRGHASAPAGVWMRTKGGLKPVMLSADGATYQRRFDMHGVAGEVIGRRFDSHILAALRAQGGM